MPLLEALSSSCKHPLIQPRQTCSIPSKLPFSVPSKLRILRRCTLLLTDPAQNHRLSQLAQNYDILALRPTDERTLQQACQSLDADLVSLDLSIRYPFHFKFGTLAAALQRGLKLEICYSQGILGGKGDAQARRNVIQNAVSLIRACRSRGIVVSSEAKRAVGLRAPADVVNLCAVWGLSQEKGKEAVSASARAVVVSAGLKRTSYRGVVDVVNGGDPASVERGKDEGEAKGKKRANEDDQETEKLSKNQKRRQAKAKREPESGKSKSSKPISPS